MIKAEAETVNFSNDLTVDGNLLYGLKVGGFIPHWAPDQHDILSTREVVRGPRLKQRHRVSLTLRQYEVIIVVSYSVDFSASVPA